MSTTTRPMTKSALAVARQALDAARAALPAHASKFAKKTSTRHQRVAARAVRQFLRTDSRGVEHHLRDWSDRRAAPGLGEDDPRPLHPTRRPAGGSGERGRGPPRRHRRGGPRAAPGQAPGGGRRDRAGGPARQPPPLPAGGQGDPAVRMAEAVGRRLPHPPVAGGRGRPRPGPRRRPVPGGRGAAAVRCRIGTRLGDAASGGENHHAHARDESGIRSTVFPVYRRGGGAGPVRGTCRNQMARQLRPKPGGPVAAGVRPAVGQPGGGGPAAGRGS